MAVITGASRGIGRAVAQRLSAEGMRLVLAARSADDLQAVSASCSGEVMAFPTDLRDPDAPGALIAYALKQFGRLDLLVNNAGATRRGDFLTLTEDDWQDGFALKFFSAVRCSRSAWPHLVESGGSVINVVGIGGRTGSAEFAIGGSVNAAVLNLTKVLADRGVGDGVRVNAINPGAIWTDRLTRRITVAARERGISEDEAAAQMAQAMGVARFGMPEEIAGAAAFLASADASYCNGAILDVDGGHTRTL